mgnify:FL=1
MKGRACLEEASGATRESTAKSTGESTTEGTGESAAKTRSTEATRSAEATTGHPAAHLGHQAVHFAHQFLHFGSHLALLETSLECVLGATLTWHAGAAEVAGQSVTIGAESARLGERAKSAGSTCLCEGAFWTGVGLGSAGNTAETVGKRERNADLRALLNVLINFVYSTHDEFLYFRDVLLRYYRSLGRSSSR